ncbi:MAG: glycosyltransferase, partial [Gemmatimonadaceae bacterium]|nr:glycosyltransferase [Gemmatimonadaceae bacterium]
MLTALLIAQVIATIVLLARLEPGRRRKPPVAPRLTDEPASLVSIVVPVLDEAQRIAPLIAGVVAQGAPVSEIVFVDSGSRDGTRALLESAAQRDGRIRVETDPPLPDGWIGKAWALQHGATVASGQWLLGLDADTAPRPGLAAAVVEAAERYGYDAVSFAPRFAGQRPLERWLQPAMLATLVYRLGPAGDESPPERLLANGQCFLVRRDVLLAHGGYAPV